MSVSEKSSNCKSNSTSLVLILHSQIIKEHLSNDTD